MWRDVYPVINDRPVKKTGPTNAQPKQGQEWSVGEFEVVADVLDNLTDQDHNEADDKSC